MTDNTTAITEHRTDVVLDPIAGSYRWTCSCGDGSKPVLPSHAAWNLARSHEQSANAPQIPGQPDDIEDDSRDLPSPVRAAARVREYICANGDGIYDVIDGNPLYARDLESLRRAGEQVGNLVMDNDKLRAQVADLADKLHKANADNASLTKAGTAWANEVAELRKVVEAVESLLMVTDGDPLGDHGIAIPLGEIRRVLGEARAEVA